MDLKAGGEKPQGKQGSPSEPGDLKNTKDQDREPGAEEMEGDEEDVIQWGGDGDGKGSCG